MNKPLQTVEAASVASQALVTLDPTSYAATVYEPFNKRLEAAIAASNGVTYDIKTSEGMKVAKDFRATFRAIRTEGEKERVAHKAPIVAIGKLLDSKYSEIESAIRPYENKFDADIKAEETRIEEEKAAKLKAEEDAKAAVQNKIDAIKNKPLEVMNKPVAEIEAAIAELSILVPTPADFGDRHLEAEYALKATLETLDSILAGKKAQEQLEAQVKEQAAKADAAAKEQARVAGIKAKIQAIRNFIITGSECDLSSQIIALITEVDDFGMLESDYQEFYGEAVEAKLKTLNALNRQLNSLLQAEQADAEARQAEFKAKLEVAAKEEFKLSPGAADITKSPINNLINEADFSKHVAGVDLAAGEDKTVVTNIGKRPTAEAIINLVATTYSVDQPTAQRWLTQSFAQAKAA